MSIRKKTHEQQAREFWDFARHVSEEVEEWPTWKRNTLVSFSTGVSHPTSKQDQKVTQKNAGNTVKVGRKARTGQFVSVKETRQIKNASAVGGTKKKK